MKKNIISKPFLGLTFFALISTTLTSCCREKSTPDLVMELLPIAVQVVVGEPLPFALLVKNVVNLANSCQTKEEQKQAATAPISRTLINVVDRNSNHGIARKDYATQAIAPNHGVEQKYQVVFNRPSTYQIEATANHDMAFFEGNFDNNKATGVANGRVRKGVIVKVVPRPDGRDSIDYAKRPPVEIKLMESKYRKTQQ